MNRMLDALRGTERNENQFSCEAPVGTKYTQLLASVQGEMAPIDDMKRIVCRLQPGDQIIGCSQNDTAVSERFRVLRHRLDRLRLRQPLTSILITGSVPQEGKTLVAVNLAITLAMTSSRVLLVDADLRKPKIHTTLRLRPLPGLTDFLEGRLQLEPLGFRIDPFGFYYLPAGSATTKPVELLQSARMQQLLQELNSRFDWVVLDSPPLLPFADAQCLAPLCDTVLLVVRERFTTRLDFQHSLESLREANVAGVVLNWSESSHSGSYYSYYVRPSTVTLAAPSQGADQLGPKETQNHG